MHCSRGGNAGVGGLPTSGGGVKKAPPPKKRLIDGPTKILPGDTTGPRGDRRPSFSPSFGHPLLVPEWPILRHFGTFGGAKTDHSKQAKTTSFGIPCGL